VAWWNLFRRRRRRKPEPNAEWLVAGLGNPGPKYEASRHNFGFMAAEALVSRCSGVWTAVDEPPLESSCLRLGEGITIQVVRPLAYMNRSGPPVRWALRSSDLDVSRLIVLVDDLALPLGAMRIREGGGDGGHNGLRSIAEALESGAFTRVRLGVAPVDGMLPAGEWVDYVLGSFEPGEEERVQRMAGLAADAVMEIICHGSGQAMSRFNRRHKQ